MKAKKGSVILGLVGVIATAGLLYAAVTFDPATGTGFVGKGDVQLAFGWNNAVMQTNSQALEFFTTQDVLYGVPCKKLERGNRLEVCGQQCSGPPHNRTCREVCSPCTPGSDDACWTWDWRFHTFNRDRSVSSIIAYSARQRNQYTGFNLTGYGPTVETGDPLSCPSEQGSNIWVQDGDPEVITEGPVNLFVRNSGGGTAMLWTSAIPTP